MHKRTRVRDFSILPTVAILTIGAVWGCKMRRGADSEVTSGTIGDYQKLHIDYIAGCGGKDASVAWSDENPPNALALMDAATSSGRGVNLPAVKSLLERKCATCHTPSSDEAAAFSDILNVKELVDKRMISKAEPLKSKVLEVILNDRMPKGGADKKLKAEEKELVRAWLLAGAPDLNASASEVAGYRGTVISEIDKITCMAKDLTENVPERQRAFIRYFTFTHLYNGGQKGELARQGEALSKLVNSLSRHAKISRPVPIDAAGTIYKIDLRNYKWTAATWNQIIARNPYNITYNNETAKSVYRYTADAQPYARGDWFAFSASRPPLYHDILELPAGVKADHALEKREEVDVARNLFESSVLRAGFRQSGVSAQNRIIERHASRSGYYWKSYDFSAASDVRKNIFDHPLDFTQDGGEIIFSLPNGLQAYLLIDKNGNRIDAGPTDIVQHPKRRRDQQRVINGVSCMDCHREGIIPKDDQIRGHVSGNAATFSQRHYRYGSGNPSNEYDVVMDLYRQQTDLNKVYAADRKRFKEAVEEAGGSVDREDPVFLVAQGFEDPVSEAMAAAEVGLSLEEFRERLIRNPELKRKLAFETAGSVDRQTFLSIFGPLASLAGTGGSGFSPALPGHVPSAYPNAHSGSATIFDDFNRKDGRLGSPWSTDSWLSIESGKLVPRNYSGPSSFRGRALLYLKSTEAPKVMEFDYWIQRPRFSNISVTWFTKGAAERCTLLRQQFGYDHDLTLKVLGSVFHTDTRVQSTKSSDYPPSRGHMRIERTDKMFRCLINDKEVTSIDAPPMNLRFYGEGESYIAIDMSDESSVDIQTAIDNFRLETITIPEK